MNEKTPEENIIKQAYDTLFDKDENGKAPDTDTFLERLINLESLGKEKLDEFGKTKLDEKNTKLTALKRGLFRTLLESKSNSEVREYLKSKRRDEWEKIISEEYLGKKMTIVDVINNYSEEIKKAFKEKSVKQALEELGIKCRKIDGMILPPEGNQRILPGNNELSDVEKEKIEMKFKRFQEKFNILFGDVLTVENEIFPGDFEVIVGENENDALRFKSYIAVWIKKLNKTIFINDRAGESTFVCDAIVSEEDMKSKSKKKMKEYLGDAFHSVSYSENQKEKWKLNMIDLICGPEKGTQKLTKMIRQRYQELKSKDPQKIELRFSSQITYKKNLTDIKAFFGEGMANSFKSLIPLLGGRMTYQTLGKNKICENGEYVKSLLESKEDGEKFFNKWKIEQEKKIKITPEILRQKYQELKSKKPQKIELRFGSSHAYLNNIEEIKNRFGEGTPSTIKGLIPLLGGTRKVKIGGKVKTCLTGEYIQALLESEEKGEEYLNKWKIEQEKKIKITPEILRQKYQELKSKEPQKIELRFGSMSSYEANIQNVKNRFGEGMGGGHRLIKILGGKQKHKIGGKVKTCSTGEYVQALFESEEKGEEYLNKWKIEQEKKIKITPEILRQKYQELKSKEPQKIELRFGSSHAYLNNIEEIKNRFGEGMGGWYRLISSLGGEAKDYSTGEYIQALLESEEAGKQYLQYQKKKI